MSANALPKRPPRGTRWYRDTSVALTRRGRLAHSEKGVGGNQFREHLSTPAHCLIRINARLEAASHLPRHIMGGEVWPFSFSAEEIKAAPVEVRRWLERQARQSFDQGGDAGLSNKRSVAAESTRVEQYRAE